MTLETGQEETGESRRQFLKKAGAVAWVVPTMQMVNMASAAAGIRHFGGADDNRDVNNRRT